MYRNLFFKVVLIGLIISSCQNLSVFSETSDFEKPDETNTGPSGTLALIDSKLTITESNTVIEDIEVNSYIYIDADNVTIRNFKVNATSPYGILIEDGRTGIVLEYGEISGMSSAGIFGTGFSAYRLNIHDSGQDGIKLKGDGKPVLVEYCYIHSIGTAVDSHADGCQMRSGGSNVVFRYNNIYIPVAGTANYPGEPYKSNATFMLHEEIENFIIENNWLNGGNYSIYGRPGVIVRDNYFGYDFRFGIRSGTVDVWENNIFEDTGMNIE